MVRVMALLSEDDIERIARKRAGAKLGWYIHATVFVLVNLGMFAAFYLGLARRAWSVAPVLGWGAGLLLHGISVFLLATGSPLRERMLQRERDRLQREQQDRASGR
jgi:membrane protein implicated in regulation of membrane protease activity